MTRSEALAPLNKGEGRFHVTAGMAIRGAVRRGALRYGVDYYEERGWFDSAFVVRGDAGSIIQFKAALDQAFGDD